jgi:hypothetical protein
LSFPSPPFAFPFDFGPFKMLDSASEVLLGCGFSLGFGLTSSFAVSLKVVFLVCLSQQLLQYPAKEYPDYLLLFALPQLLLVQIDGFCRLNVARPKLRRSKVYGNSIFRRGI